MRPYKHCKAIAANGEGIDFLKSTFVGNKLTENRSNAIVPAGVIINYPDDVSMTADEFIKAIARHRFWEREMQSNLPA